MIEKITSNPVLLNKIEWITLNVATGTFVWLNDFMSNPITWVTGLALAFYNFARGLNEIKKLFSKSKNEGDAN